MSPTSQTSGLPFLKKLYFQLYLNAIDHEINKQNQDIMNRFIKGALSIYKTGRGNQTDILKATIELQKLQDQWLELENEQVTLQAMINTLLDCDPMAFLGNPQITYHPLIAFSYNALESMAFDHRPELIGIQAMVDEQYERKRLAKLNYFPDVTIEFMIQDRPSRNKRAWGINLGFNIPIWIGQKQSNEVEEAKANMLAHTATLHNTQAIIRGNIKSIISNIEQMEEKIKLFEGGLLRKTAQTLASYESSYKTAKGNFTLILDTRRQLQDFEFDYESARISREILLAQLEREIGISIDKIIKRCCNKELKIAIA